MAPYYTSLSSTSSKRELDSAAIEEDAQFGKAVGGVVAGILLVVLLICLLWWLFGAGNSGLNEMPVRTRAGIHARRRTGSIGVSDCFGWAAGPSPPTTPQLAPGGGAFVKLDRRPSSSSSKSTLVEDIDMPSLTYDGRVKQPPPAYFPAGNAPTLAVTCAAY
ncbi:hypothetical protein BDW22DRAFT_1426251 [Trametopsis cervina]|nr:hypothetical protein BDW22DRAFT_1426251 [Trametopsis cervina]